ncbi:unnamed protein product [Trifolium pratense]|uniref:Uncharacterized protein n=1 Tax=Trifolium pratense TaxID=57577 RepID=A0ACB0LGD7_TRIPR|nr:unnamed protein product [Trifolium pratense]
MEILQFNRMQSQILTLSLHLSLSFSVFHSPMAPNNPTPDVDAANNVPPNNCPSEEVALIVPETDNICSLL